MIAGNNNIFSENNENSEALKNSEVKSPILYSLVLPFIFILFSFTGLYLENNSKDTAEKIADIFETKGGQIKNAGKFNILSSQDNSSGIKDTVYTDKETWLELRIDQQMLYQHWRDGRVVKFPVSTGNKTASDPEALESRPGIFAVFHKVLHHQSTQFNAANMYHFMPFNQGIGFHSIDGRAYYAHLGVRPSSHGCIRMKHEDAERLFKESPLGTLVLASKGFSARTIAFADKDFVNEKDYTKEEMKYMTANNLYNLAIGRYYIEERKKFVIDPKYIPVSGIYNGYDLKIPENQIMPRSFVVFHSIKDKLYAAVVSTPEPLIVQDEFEDVLVSNEAPAAEQNDFSVESSKELIKKYFHNPIGILPYFGPKR